METPYLGEIFALSAALTWAMALILFKLSGDRVSAVGLNLFKNTIGLLLLLLTLLVMGEDLGTLRRFPPEDLVILMLSGFLGITLADTAFLAALHLVGVGIISIVECLYCPLVILLAFVLLREKLTMYDYAGAGLILLAVFTSSGHKPPVGRTHSQMVLGILLGALAMVLMALGIVIAKPVLEINNFPLIWAATLRLLVGTAALALLTLASPKGRKHWSVFRPASVWAVSIPASVLGTYLAMIFWIGGFKFAPASVAGILNQMSVVFAILLAAIFLNEKLTRRKLMAIAVALVGVVLVTIDLP